MEIRCNKEVEFGGRTYANKGEMIEVESVGSFITFKGSNGLSFTLSLDYAIQHFSKSDIEKLVKK